MTSSARTQLGLNLVRDAWIPVRVGTQTRYVRPWEIVDPAIEWVDWSRGDLNLACLELLIGMVLIADPPRDRGDLVDRFYRPDASRLRDRMEALAGFFEFAGAGPRFMQDLEPFETAPQSEPRPIELIFLDAGGMRTRVKNADLAVQRGRYDTLSLGVGAMALYTLQAWAPAGGPGQLTSLRGGGPLVTLSQPGDLDRNGLWRTVWLNTPYGVAEPPHQVERALPWLRETRSAVTGETVNCEDEPPALAFFAMPRRVRLLIEDDRVVSYVLRKHGARYEGWEHPLTPYRWNDKLAKPMPVSAQPGRMSYRNWLGTVLRHSNSQKWRCASVVTRGREIEELPGMRVLAGGWAMDKMKPRDFAFEIYPNIRTDGVTSERVTMLAQAGAVAMLKLDGAVREANRLFSGTSSRPKAKVSEVRGSREVREEILSETEEGFTRSVEAVANGAGREVEVDWNDLLRRVALRVFDRHLMPALSVRGVERIERVTKARRFLRAAFGEKGAVGKLLIPATNAGRERTT